MSSTNQGYVIGVDGGGSKTVAVLANLRGRILARHQVGSSHPRNIGIKNAINNLAQAIEKVLGKIKGDKKILATFLGLPAMEEEFKLKKEIIKRKLLKHREIRPIFKGKVIIGSDQLAGFRSGINEKDGVILIAGSGSVCHGWKGKKEVITDSCGYLSEAGSAFFVGQKALQAVFKDLDGRDKKTLLTKLIFQKLKIKTKENLVSLVYSKEPREVLLSLSVLCDTAAKKRDKIAEKILIEAGRELALSTNTVIRKLNFQKVKFPLVLIGSMFKSKIVLDTAKKEIRKFALRVKFIRPGVEPVVGAVKLALAEVLNNGND